MDWFADTKGTGGIAYKQWFDNGHFVISVGGYHPRFSVPSNYPIVPRLKIYWKLGNWYIVKVRAI